MRRNILLFSLILTTSVILAGCGMGQSIGQQAGEKMLEKAIESQTGGQVDISGDKGSMTVKSADGQSEISTGGEAKLPTDFPKELIKADDAKIVMSTTAPGGNTVAYTTKSDQTTILEKYKTEMIGQGWKKELEMDYGTAKMLNFTKNKETLSVNIGDNTDSDQTGQTMVNIVLVKDETADRVE